MRALILPTHIDFQSKNDDRKQSFSLVKIGGIPAIIHQINLLKTYRISDITIHLHHNNDPLIRILNDTKLAGTNISYIITNDLLSSHEWSKLAGNTLLVLSDNIMMHMQLQKFNDFHQIKNSDLSLAIQPYSTIEETILVQTDFESRVTAIHKPPHKSGFYYPGTAFAGIMICSPTTLKCLKPGTGKESLPEKLLEMFKHTHVYGYRTSEYLKSFTNRNDIHAIENDWTQGVIRKSGYENKQKAIFLDRDGVMNEEAGYLKKPSDLVLFDFTPAAIKKINTSSYKAIMVSNQSAIARNLCTPEELQTIHNKMESDLRKEKAHLDGLYICPHLPPEEIKGLESDYMLNCKCRKPKPGLLLNASEDFNLNLSQSFIIGDSERDILAGKNAGCNTVGVRTGYGLKSASLCPDLMFQNLDEAIHFIIDEPYLPILDKISSSGLGSPGIITIGGNHRSGKSTLASWLTIKLEQQKRTVLMISTDPWKINTHESVPSGSGSEKLILQELIPDLQAILGGMVVEKNIYTEFAGNKENRVAYHYQGEDFIIIEGLGILGSEIIRNLSRYIIYMDINKHHFRSRIRDYYSWLGWDTSRIDLHCKQLLKDEYAYIEKHQKYTDFIVPS